MKRLGVVLLLGVLVVALLCLGAADSSREQHDKTDSGAARWTVTYTEVFSEDFETVGPALRDGFVLTEYGALSDQPEDVIAGTRSIKGTYNGSDKYSAYFRTDPAALLFVPNHTYRVTFDYRILTTPTKGFETLFYSPTGGRAGNWLPSINVNGKAGDTGHATLTNTLENYTDYEARWNVVGNGAIAIDNIEIRDLSSGQTVATEDAEGVAPTLTAGSRLGPQGTAVVRDEAKVVTGQASATLHDFGTFETDPTVVELKPNTTYLVQFDYHGRIGDDGNESVLVFLHPEGETDYNSAICLRPLLRNAPTVGTYSGGALTGAATRYYLHIMAIGGVSITVDNIRIVRQQTILATGGFQDTLAVSGLPFPRLGKYLMGTTTDMAVGGLAEGKPFTYSVDEIERRAAAFDVLIGSALSDQTWDPDFPRRMRALNPSILILPYRLAQEEGFGSEPVMVCGGNREVYPELAFREGIANEWIVKTTAGKPVEDPDWKTIRKMNIYDSCPVVGGETFNDHLIDFVLNDIFASGLWDGVMFDNLFDRINPHIPYYNDSARLDYDVNQNGVRDETPPHISEMTRAAATDVLQQIRSEAGASQLILGNGGALSLAPYVNGYLLEGWNGAWCYNCEGRPSEAAWKRAIDDYLSMTKNALAPRISVVEGSGCTGAFVTPDHAYLEPTALDIRTHRFTMGSALLGDGFYGYDLFDGRSAPYWFDEYTVSPDGVASEDAQFKGYLGHPLGDAVELSTPATLVWQETFESAGLPREMWGQLGVRVGHSPEDVITGTGSLVIDNPDHTKQIYMSAGTNAADIPLQRGKTYVIEFAWRILETLDSYIGARVWGTGTDFRPYYLPGIVKGDAGHARFPVTLDSGGDFSVQFILWDGGGKVAIDNIRMTEGGAGPWRRDFKNGFVLVNPLNRPATFDVKMLSGALSRTGIRRILGSQAPDINNGKPVTGPLTLEPFDAIILLADPIARP
jgi:hypothetical protein